MCTTPPLFFWKNPRMVTWMFSIYTWNGRRAREEEEDRGKKNEEGFKLESAWPSGYTGLLKALLVLNHCFKT